jgi:hypothetical protein
MRDNPAKRSAFPYVATGVCALCVSIGAWLWMIESYAWSVTPESVWRNLPPVAELCASGSPGVKWRRLYYAHFRGSNPDDEEWAIARGSSADNSATYKAPFPRDPAKVMILRIRLSGYIVPLGYATWEFGGEGRVYVTGVRYDANDVPQPQPLTDTGAPAGDTDAASARARKGLVYFVDVRIDGESSRFTALSGAGLCVGGIGLLVFMIAVLRLRRRVPTQRPVQSGNETKISISADIGVVMWTACVRGSGGSGDTILIS